jgi:single-stranded DNA-binding protein
MADSESIRNGQPTRPSIYLAGELSKQPVLIDMPARKTKVARPVIRVGKEEFEVLAEGMLAQRFANILAGTPVMVAGHLAVYRWDVDGKKHERFQIVAERMVP